MFLLQAKRDRQNKTGAAGGKAQVLTAVDDLVLEIVGKDSAAVCGISTQEMWDDLVEPSPCPMQISTQESPAASQPITLRVIEETENFVPVKGTRKRERRSEKDELEMEFYRLRNENLRLQNELLKIKIARKQRSHKQSSFFNDLNDLSE